MKFLLYPEDRVKEIWDICIVLVLFVSLVITPMRITFGPTIEITSWKICDEIMNILFLIDIIVLFNCAHFDDEFVIAENRKIIARDYLKSWFLIDFISIVPFEDAFTVDDYSYD